MNENRFCAGKPLNGAGLFFYTFWVAGAIWLLQACSGTAQQGNKNVLISPPPAPDYRLLEAWAAHPAKKDLSDSLPPVYKGQPTDTLVDVFFIHPTSYLEKKILNKAQLNKYQERVKWNAAIEDEKVNNATDKGSMLYQASAFNHYRVFAPRYRQAHIQSFFLPDSVARPFFDTAYADVVSAFEYFLDHENQGRPFIIASHSQGTLHAGRLLREKVEGTPLQQRLIAAYLPGLPVPVDFFKSMKPCDQPGETGCFVSWRTFKKGYEPAYVEQESFKAMVVNPLSWTRDSTWVPRTANKGAILYRFNKPLEQNVGAGIHGNILWSSKPRFLGNIFFTRKNYHIGDINLFWKNIRDNVEERVEAYRKIDND